MQVVEERKKGGICIIKPSPALRQERGYNKKKKINKKELLYRAKHRVYPLLLRWTGKISIKKMKPIK